MRDKDNRWCGYNARVQGGLKLAGNTCVMFIDFSMTRDMAWQ
jgi:hypothetical protein